MGQSAPLAEKSFRAFSAFCCATSRLPCKESLRMFSKVAAGSAAGAERHPVKSRGRQREPDQAYGGTVCTPMAAQDAFPPPWTVHPSSARTIETRNKDGETSNSPRKILPKSGISKTWPKDLPGIAPPTPSTNEHRRNPSFSGFRSDSIQPYRSISQRRASWSGSALTLFTSLAACCRPVS